MVNMWAIFRDPHVWKGSLEFIADRFVAKDGKTEFSLMRLDLSCCSFFPSTFCFALFLASSFNGGLGVSWYGRGGSKFGLILQYYPFINGQHTVKLVGNTLAGEVCVNFHKPSINL